MDTSQNAVQHTVTMPTELTAANGAKAALMGEFYVEVEEMCPCCIGTGGEDDEDCEECAGNGEVSRRVVIDWDTIKQIYRKAVETCGKANNA